MNQLFLKVVNLGISASWLIAVVLILRILLKKAPKWINVLLWGIVAVRLICPISFESKVSLVPSAETIPLNIDMKTEPAINSGIDSVNNIVNPVLSQNFTPQPATTVNPLQIWILLASVVWLIGMMVMLLYATISYLRLRHRVATAVLYRDIIYQSENVAAPFVLGIIRPRIYLPFHEEEERLKYVVAHEQAHISRKDHWWKPLGFLLLTIHWFNPLIWLAYVLLCRDIELACDEKVIRKLDHVQRADYTQALVICSVNRRMIAACPLAFGEVGVTTRVKSVMNYKKPAFWTILISVIACLAVGICFLTNPPSEEVPYQEIKEEVVDLDKEASDSSIYQEEQQENPISEEVHMQAYASFLAGDRTLVNNDSIQWWVPDFRSAGILEYEYTYMDLDGDGTVELLVQMVNEPTGYNGVFHYEAGQLYCWNSDASEMSCRDYPLIDGTMVRQYDISGNSSYTIFSYSNAGEKMDVHRLFAHPELMSDTDTEACPYYEVDGEEVSKEVFEDALKEKITDKVLRREEWKRIE